jgi:hypothetical protein
VHPISAHEFTGGKKRWCGPVGGVEGASDQRLLMIIKGPAARLPHLSGGKIAFG